MKAGWLKPLDFVPQLVQRKTPDTSKPIWVDGKRYGSIGEAKDRLGCGYWTIYRLMEKGRARYA